MLLGPLTIFGLVVLMNSFIHTPEVVTGGSSTFSVEKIVPQKPDNPKPETIKKKRQTPEPMKNLAPLPNLGTSLSGIAITLPGFEAANLKHLADNLFGDLNTIHTTVMTEETVDDRPVPIHRVPAEYPARARSHNVSGYVTLGLLIGKDGMVKNIRVLEANPFGIFDDAAVKAVRQWQFQPATYNQQEVEVWAKQTIRFEIS